MALITATTSQNYTNIGHVDNDEITVSSLATLTIDTDTNRIEDLRCITTGEFNIENSSSTTPIFIELGDDTVNSLIRIEGGGRFIVNGNWITLGTSDGTSGQSFTLPTNASGEKIPEVPTLFTYPVGETKSVIFNATDSLTDSFGDEKLGTLFIHDYDTNTVTFGDGYEGYIPPIGTVIKIPSIVFIDTSTNGYYTDFDLSTSGTISLDKCMFTSNFAFNFANASSTTLRNVGFGSSRENFNISSQQGAVLENLGIILEENYYVGGTGSSEMTVDNVFLYITHSGNGYGFISGSASIVNIDGLRAVAPNIPASTSRAMIHISSSDVKITNSYTASANIGIYFLAGAGGDSYVKDSGHNGAGKRNPTAYSYYMVHAINVANVLIDNYNSYPLLATDGATAVNYYAFSFSTGTSGFTVNNCDVYCGEETDVNTISNPIYSNGTNHRVNDIRVYGHLSGDTINHGTISAGLEARNIKFMNEVSSTADIEWSDGSFYDLVSTPDRLDTAPPNSGIRSSSSHVYKNNDLLSGYLFRVMAQDGGQGLFNEVTVNGEYAFDNAGSLYMTTSGDVLEFETQVHGGITSFSDFVLTGSSTSNFDIQFALRNPDGVYSSYQSLDTVNLNSELTALVDYDYEVGLQIKYRIERTASNVTDYLSNIRVDTVIADGYTSPFDVYPTYLTFKGLTVDDSVYVENGSNVQKLFEVSADGSDIELSLPNANDGETWTYVVKRAGYSHQRGTFNIESGVDVTVNVNLSEKLQPTGGAMYTHSSSLNVSVDIDLVTPQLNIDIGTADILGQTVFDVTENALVTNDGMTWLARYDADTSYANLGGAGSFLFHEGSIRVRREEIEDENAGIQAYVFSTDGEPVDETNGTVQLFSGTIVNDFLQADFDDEDGQTVSVGQLFSMLNQMIEENGSGDYRFDSTAIEKVWDVDVTGHTAGAGKTLKDAKNKASLSASLSA